VLSSAARREMESWVMKMRRRDGDMAVECFVVVGVRMWLLNL